MDNAETYEPIHNGPGNDTTLRLREALAVINTLLPNPLTVADVISSAEQTKKLIKAHALARTYQACQRNLECLSKHQVTGDNPSLTSIVESHIANARRLSDSCLAAIVHLYLSVGSVDTTTDTIVDQAIRMSSENNIVMADVAVLEKTFGIGAASSGNRHLVTNQPSASEECKISNHPNVTSVTTMDITPNVVAREPVLVNDHIFDNGDSIRHTKKSKRKSHRQTELTME